MNDRDLVASRPGGQLDGRVQHGGNSPMPEPITSENIALRIEIEPLNHGFCITVGCQKFAVESKEALINRLAHYLADPNRVRQEWMQGMLKW